MNLQKNKKTIIAIKVDNVIDIITNSSSELFVLKGEEKSIVEEMISDIYPNYLDEYDSLKDIRTMSDDEIDDFLYWHLGKNNNNWWYGEKIYNKESDYVLLPGFKFEEIYDTSVVLDIRNNEYKVLNNIPIGLRSNEWDSKFITDENKEKIVKGIEESVGRFFLYSIDENPDWDYQEKLMNIGTRYHLG